MVRKLERPCYCLKYSIRKRAYAWHEDELTQLHVVTVIDGCIYSCTKICFDKERHVLHNNLMELQRSKLQSLITKPISIRSLQFSSDQSLTILQILDRSKLLLRHQNNQRCNFRFKLLQAQLVNPYNQTIGKSKPSTYPWFLKTIRASYF